MFNIETIKRKTVRGEERERRKEIRSTNYWIRYIKERILANAAKGESSIRITADVISPKIRPSVIAYFENKGFKTYSYYDSHLFIDYIRISWEEDPDATTE